MDFKKKHIKTSVVACIVDDRERVLLTRRCIEPFCSTWVMPGGKIDHGESILEALHREVLEEVGIGIRVDGLIDVYEHIGVGDGNDHFVILYYRAVPLSLELHPNGEECTEAVWASRHCLTRMALPPGGRHILAKVFPELPWGEGMPAALDLAEEVPGATAENIGNG